MHHLGKSIVGHDHVGGGLGNPAVGLSGQPHAAIDARRHGFAQLDERSGTRGVAGQHDLRRLEHAVPIEQATEPRQRRVVGAFARRGEVAPQVAAERLVRQFDLRQQHDVGLRWQPDAETPVDAVLAHDGQRSAIDVLDRGDVQSLPIGGAPRR